MGSLLILVFLACYEAPSSTGDACVDAWAAACHACPETIEQLPAVDCDDLDATCVVMWSDTGYGPAEAEAINGCRMAWFHPRLL